jgi:hypothetical protein
VEFKRGLVLVVRGKKFQCEIKNISLKNARIVLEKEHAFTLGTVIDFTIPLSESAKDSIICGTAKIIRIISKIEYAFEFISLDLNSFRHLATMLSFYVDNEKIIDNDIVKMFKSLME